MAQRKQAEKQGDGLPTDALRDTLQQDPTKRSLLVECRRFRGIIRVEEIQEGGHTTVVDYDSFEILTEHGLRLQVRDIGMQKTLDVMLTNANRRDTPSILETPKELLGTVTDCVGLLIRPANWQRERIVSWVEEHGPFVMHYFGDGISLAPMPELEVRSLSLVQAA